jgi:hypothetical protein
MCVRSTGVNFDPTKDTIFFTLKKKSPTVQAGMVSSGSVLVATGFGWIEVETPARMGLLPTDEITALKCYTVPRTCDINQDGKVNVEDMKLIFSARGLTPVPGDPRDVDGNGQITVNDARFCVQKCDNPNCAP